MNTLSRQVSVMNDYVVGYHYYVAKCKLFSVEPLLYHFYLQYLTNEQLQAYNIKASYTKELNI